MSNKLFLATIMFVMMMFLGACGEKKAGNDATGNVEAENNATETVLATIATEKMEDEEHDLILKERMLSSMVYLQKTVEDKQIAGLGFITEIADGKVYICTNGHVIQDYNDWQVVMYDGESMVGQNAGISSVYDVGILTVELEQAGENFEEKYVPVTINMDTWKEMQDSEDKCLIQTHKINESGLVGDIIEGEIVNFFADFKWGNKLNHTEMDIYLFEGDSGSAIFDVNGNLMTMAYGISREDGKPKRWGIPLTAIITSYKEITGRDLVQE